MTGREDKSVFRLLDLPILGRGASRICWLFVRSWGWGDVAGEAEALERRAADTGGQGENRCGVYKIPEEMRALARC